MPFSVCVPSGFGYDSPDKDRMCSFLAHLDSEIEETAKRAYHDQLQNDSKMKQKRREEKNREEQN